MDFATFNAKAESLFEQLKRLDPIAIVQFGSSLAEDDYLPGISDLDAIVVTDEPITPPENEVGFQYNFTPPREFIRRLGRGDGYMLCVMRSGKSIYDPRGFLAATRRLCDAGLPLTPTSYTLGTLMTGAGRQLSRAMNSLLGDDSGKADVATALHDTHKAVTTLGMAEVCSRTREYHSGFTAVSRRLEAIGSPLFAPLMRTRDNLLNRDRFAPPPGIKTRLAGSDDLSREVIAAERLFVEHAGRFGVPVRRMTDDLIEQYEAEYGPLDRLHAVRVETYSLKHLVMGEHGGLCRLFGFRTAGQQPVRIVEPVLPKDAPTVLAWFRHGRTQGALRQPGSAPGPDASL